MYGVDDNPVIPKPFQYILCRESSFRFSIRIEQTVVVRLPLWHQAGPLPPHGMYHILICDTLRHCIVMEVHHAAKINWIAGLVGDEFNHFVLVISILNYVFDTREETLEFVEFFLADLANIQWVP